MFGNPDQDPFPLDHNPYKQETPGSESEEYYDAFQGVDEDSLPTEETPYPEPSPETGVWYGDPGARESEIALVKRAAHNLGNLTIRTVDDPEEARNIIYTVAAARFQEKYPGAPETIVCEYAQREADVFVRDMEPSANNSNDPLRLIRVQSTDGSAVSINAIAEEIKFRVKPGLDKSPVTVEEALYTAIKPVDPLMSPGVGCNRSSRQL